MSDPKQYQPNKYHPGESPWIGIDLDGTLAEYHGFKGIDHIGPPIKPTLDFVRWLLEEGWEVRIFTARAGPQRGGAQDIVHAIQAIRAWCMKHLGRELRITAEKDFAMVWLYDDRCTQVIKNLGQPVDPPPPHDTLAPHCKMKPTKERNDNGRTKNTGMRPGQASAPGSAENESGGSTPTQDPGAGPAPS
jgi:hypothetical protein